MYKKKKKKKKQYVPAGTGRQCDVRSVLDSNTDRHSRLTSKPKGGLKPTFQHWLDVKFWLEMTMGLHQPLTLVGCCIVVKFQKKILVKAHAGLTSTFQYWKDVEIWSERKVGLRSKPNDGLHQPPALDRCCIVVGI